jgi:hypothetical protein
MAGNPHEGRRHAPRRRDQDQIPIKDSPEGSAVEMAYVLSHPLRFSILNDMNTPPRNLSPSEYSEEIGEKLGNVSYHFRILHRAGCIEIVDTFQRRGATEHVYGPVRRAMAWTAEWEKLGPFVRQHVASSALGNAVKQAGAAIDEGTFDKRNDSHLSHDTLWTDEEGWHEIHDLFKTQLVELLAITKRIEQRLAVDSGIPRFLVTYFMSTFESPPPKNVKSRPEPGST